VSSQLAALGGKKVRESSFPAWPHYDETEREALNRVLDSRNWWANQGKEVKEFEKEWSKYTNAKASFAVTNGTHTLEVIFLALGIGDGDEVIVADW
jgi:3-amino-5-hydroxybenzoate synthase